MTRARTHHRPRWLPNPVALALSLMVSLTLVVPAVYWLGPDIHRRMMIRDLATDDDDRRARALNYLLHHAEKDPAVRRGALRQLEHINNDRHFQQIVRALDMAGVWRRPTASDDVWLQWLTMLAQSSDRTARLRAAQRLADLPERANDERVQSLLTILLNDEDAGVRLNALAAVAELAGAADDPLPHEAMIGQRINDAEPAIARQAWLLLGLLDPQFGYTANWRNADPWVAEAMLWAAVQTNPDRPMAATKALAAADAPARIRRAAAYALGFAQPDEAETALLPIIETKLADETQDPITLWRAVHGLPPTDHSRAMLRRLVMHLRQSDDLDRIELAALHRLGESEMALTSLDGSPEIIALRELATLDHHWLAGTQSTLAADHPPAGDMVRLVRLATMPSPTIEALRPLLRHDTATMRDLACLVATERFDRQALEPLISELLVDYHDGAKMSGAMLVGLTGWQINLLRERADQQSNWPVRQIMRLALWMRDEHPAMDGQVTRLLKRHELPQSTVLLALLEREPIVAWDFLLAPRGEPSVDLLQLFDHYRWWYIARRYLPAHAPPLWWWADRELQRFQIDVLRSWYLLHRHEWTADAPTPTPRDK